jgi:hypothetical protein
MKIEFWIMIITAVVACYGAILSTISIISSRREKSRIVKVKISSGFLASGPRLSETMIFIGASNPGQRTVTLSLPYLQLPGNNQVLIFQNNSNVTFPHELSEGKSCTAWIEARQLGQLLHEKQYAGKIKLVGVYPDLVGTDYKSKPWLFDLEENLRSK